VAEVIHQMAQHPLTQGENLAVDTVEYGLRRWIIVLGVVLAPLMETIDSSIVNVALPTIQGNLGATLDEAAWTITGYLVANVIVIPLTPWLQARFGRRQYFLTAIIGFTIASLLCGFSTNMWQLTVLRIVQGFFGGGLIATSQSTLRDTFPPAEVGQSQGFFVIVVVIGPILAPVLGGAIIDSLSWPWIFFINLIPGVVSAVIVGTLLRNPGEPQRLRVDTVGIALLVLGIGSLQYCLDEGERNDWFGSQTIVIIAVLAVIGIASFILWELLGTREPIVDLRILRYRTVGVSLILGLCTSATLYGTTLVLPQFVQTILGFTAFDSGLLQLFRALPVMFMVPLVGGLVGTGKLDARIVMFVGWGLTAWSSFWLFHIITTESSFGDLVPPLLVGGAGSAMLFIPLLILVQSTTSAADGPKASAFITLAIQLGGSIAGALLVTIIDRRAALHLNTLAGTITATNPAVHQAVANVGIAGIFAAVVRQAQTMAFADTAFLVSVMSLAIAPLVILLRRQPHDMTAVSFD
jgi:MFS transporter, DHA2 family, multidrug resistance protein